MSLSEKLVAQLKRSAEMLPPRVGEVRTVKTSEGTVKISNVNGKLSIEQEEEVHFGIPALCIMISLDQAKERRKQILPHLYAHGIRPDVLSAVSGDSCTESWKLEKGAWGCLRSHQQAIETAMERHAQSVLVLEDDCLLDYNFLLKLNNCLKQLPDDWEVLWLGGTKGRDFCATSAGNDLVACSGFFSAHCYIVRYTAFEKVVSRMHSSNIAVDNLYSTMAAEGTIKVYAPKDFIAKQRSGFSWIRNEYRDSKRSFVTLEKSCQGAMILSLGSQRKSLATNCGASLIRTNPQLDIAIISDSEFEFFETIKTKRKVNFESRSIKTVAIAKSPWEFGVLMDDDTIALRPFGLPSEILDGYDIAMAVDECVPTIGKILRHGTRKGTHGKGTPWLTQEEADYTAKNFPDFENKPHFNSGIIFYRKTPELLSFLEVWKSEWQRFGRVDQIALFRAIELTGIKVKIISNEFHHRSVVKSFLKPAKIVHFCGQKWQQESWMKERNITYIKNQENATCCGKIRNALSAAGRLAAKATKGESIKVDKQVAQARAKICRMCPLIAKGKCTHSNCGCYISLKTKLTTESCPISKW